MLKNGHLFRLFAAGIISTVALFLSFASVAFAEQSDVAISSPIFTGFSGVGEAADVCGDSLESEPCAWESMNPDTIDSFSSIVSSESPDETWSPCGDCEWKILNGRLEIRPACGNDYGKLDSIDNVYRTAPWNSRCSEITSIAIEPGVSAGANAALFFGCTNLRSANLANLDTSSVVSMKDMFFNCSSLLYLDLSNWNTSRTKDLYGMFQGCRSLVSIDMTNWDMSSVEDMGQTFISCSSLNSIYGIDRWNVTSVNSFNSTFAGCSSLTHLDLSRWKTDSVSSVLCMFENCSSLASLNLSGWNTSGLKSLLRMFSDCSSLSSLDLTGWDTSSVVNMNFTFGGCSALISLDLSSFETPSLREMEGTFGGCGSLKVLDLSSFDTSNVQSMNGLHFGSLRIVVVGDKFSFSGANSRSQFSLPDYINDLGDIEWRDESGNLYEADEVPSNVAGIYRATHVLMQDAAYLDYSLPFIFTGQPIEPTVHLYGSGLNGVTYDVSYFDNVNAGIARAVITGTGDTVGKVELTFEIARAVPDVEAPGPVTAREGQRIGDVALPDGWSWDEPDWVVGSDPTSRSATFAPADGANYESVSRMVEVVATEAGRWVLDGGGWWWLAGDGSYPASCWKNIDGSWYYFDASGYMRTGWLLYCGSWYYLDPGGSMATGWRCVGGRWYYLASSGEMAVGWLLDGGSWYYLGSDGSMATGWRYVGGSWYYLGPSGAMVTGWLWNGGSWYYLEPGGPMAVGWRLVGSRWYFFEGSGAMAHDRWEGDYYLTASGEMATSQWVGPWYVGADGRWTATA